MNFWKKEWIILFFPKEKGKPLNVFEPVGQGSLDAGSGIQLPLSRSCFNVC